MRKWLSLALALMLLCGSTAMASSGYYQLGDTMDDFSVTLSDGSEVSLYGLLAQKKAVLINFWASWCSPCKREFPALDQAYAEMSDQIGVIALSCEPSDTDAIVLSLKDELGLTSLPMGLDNGVEKRFNIQGYPTSVLVDRNGVICFLEVGSIPDKNKFIRLFSALTAEDYAEPKLMTAVPEVVSPVEYPSAEELGQALALTDERIAARVPEDTTVWPFVAKDDGVTALNGEAQGTSAVLELSVSAEAGEGLQYEYALHCMPVIDSLTVSVDGAVTQYYGGDVDWSSDYVRFDAAGTHVVRFAFARGTSPLAEASAELRKPALLAAAEVDALIASAPVYPKPLAGTECAIEPVGDSKQIIMKDSSPTTGDNSTAMTMVPAGKQTFRICIGADVDPAVAYVADNTTGALLVNLPHDDRGFLYETTVASVETGSESPYNVLLACSSALDHVNCYINKYTCLASEADADAYIAMVKNLAKATGVADYQMSWEYEDGSPKQSEDAAATTQALPDGTAEYRVLVTDEAGAPVSGAMIQICDETTCQVAVTDASGLVTHVATPYPYEFHLLKAPDGFAPDTTTYALPIEGGEVNIVLVKQ